MIPLQCPKSPAMQRIWLNCMMVHEPKSVLEHGAQACSGQPITSWRDGEKRCVAELM